MRADSNRTDRARRPFTPAEDALLERHWGSETMDQLMLRFAGRTARSLHSRRHRLRLDMIRRQTWRAPANEADPQACVIEALIAHHAIGAPRANTTRNGVSITYTLPSGHLVSHRIR